MGNHHTNHELYLKDTKLELLSPENIQTSSNNQDFLQRSFWNPQYGINGRGEGQFYFKILEMHYITDSELLGGGQEINQWFASIFI